jgi:transcriptional regulator with XRE-family HTH domain
MRFDEKLRKQMLIQGLNQQRLSRASGVSDSEVSRILGGKSQPGLEIALKLARAVGVSLDYLADDSLDDEPPASAGASVAPQEEELLEIGRELGLRNAANLLSNARFLGVELAFRRLLGIVEKPVIEVGDGGASVPGRPPRANTA